MPRLDEKKKAQLNKIVESGKSLRQAYRIIERAEHQNWRTSEDFDYDKETPRGEWV